MQKISVVFTLVIILQSVTSKGQNQLEDKAVDLQQVLDKVVDSKKIYGTSFCLKYKGQIWCGNAGNMSENQQYFIASTTKLFATAITLRLISEKKLSFDDKINKYLSDDILKGLHVYKGIDYSNEITIRNLLAHTSGLPDYFQNKESNGKSLEEEIFSGNDQFWTFEQAIEKSKHIKPLFAPNTKNKAHYADTNFQLLGKIIEVITQKTFSENCQELIIKPLNLTKTYLFADITDVKPKTLYYKQSELAIPKAMTSFGVDGGMVSNSQEMLVFIDAFFNGKLFPKNYIHDLRVWNKIFPPIKSGIGIHLFKLPKILGMPEMIGHSGLSGALAYYDLKDDIYVAGTVNQIAYPPTSFTVATKLIQTAKQKKKKTKTVSGIGLGMTYSSIKNNNGNPKLGFLFELYKEYMFFKHLSLTTQILYNQKGEKSTDVNKNIRLHYIDLPIMVKLNFLDNKLGLSTGISSNILLGSNKKKNTFQRFEYSIPFAVKYAIADFLHLTFRYNFGITDITKYAYVGQELKNNWFGISVLLVKP